ncbi:hypothetical protein BH18CHL1_BH18CHL1_08610 [soil metagenome]
MAAMRARGDAAEDPGEPSEGTGQAQVSALDAALARVGDRWSFLIVEALLGGPLRFGELSGRVGGIAANVLTDRLRRLAGEGVVISEPYSRRPLRVSYLLTEEGRELAGVLRLLAVWGSTRAGDGDGATDVLRHLACGTALDARWYCPTCDRVTAGVETSSLRYM